VEIQRHLHGLINVYIHVCFKCLTYIPDWLVPHFLPTRCFCCCRLPHWISLSWKTHKRHDCGI